MPAVRRTASVFVVVFALWLLGVAPPAAASHFRFANVSWKPRPDIGPFAVEFSVTAAFRRSAYSGSAPDGFPAVGDVIQETVGTTAFLPGDGTRIPPSGPLSFEVTAINAEQDWLIGVAEVPFSGFDKILIHEYPAATAPGGGPWEAGIDTCCRIGPGASPPHVNNPSGRYRVITRVDLSAGNFPPISSGVPIIQCPTNTVCQFLVPGADLDRDPLRWRLATDLEAAGLAGGFTQPGPPHCGSALAVDPSSGLVTWNTAGCPLGLYSTQVVIEDLGPSSEPLSSAAIDFFVHVIEPGTNNFPVFDVPPTPDQPLTAPAGVLLQFQVQCTDPDAGNVVTLGNGGLPEGMTCTSPPAANSVNSTCSWTPTLSQVGVFLVTFTCTDDLGAMSLHAVQMDVKACGNGMLDPGEQCDPPQDAACPGACIAPGEPEECRCQATPTPTATPTATVTPTLTSTATPTATPSACGNGKLDPGEECDDGGVVPGDGCDQNCRREIAFCCGNPGTSCNADDACPAGDVCCNTHCDLGPEPGCDGLGPPCGTDLQCGPSGMCCGPVCGNGFVEPGEQCDEGDANGGPGCGCSSTCTFAGTCTDDPSRCCTSDSECVAGTCCGNGVVTAPEECDDANRIDDDTCSNECKVVQGVPACPGFQGTEVVQATVRRTMLLDRGLDGTVERWRTRGSAILSPAQASRFDPERQNVRFLFAERDANGDRVELWPSSPVISPASCPPAASCYERRGRASRFRWRKVRDASETHSPGVRRSRFRQRDNEIRFGAMGGKAQITAPSDLLAQDVFLVRQEVAVGDLCLTVQLECRQRRRRLRCKPTLREVVQ